MAGEVSDNFVSVKFKYTTPEGEVKYQEIQVEKGAVFNFNDKDGYYENSYTINDKGQIVAQYGPNGKNNSVIQQIEVTQDQIAQMQAYVGMQDKDGKPGLSLNDFDIADREKTQQIVSRMCEDADVYTFKQRHPFWRIVLPDAVIKHIVK